MENRRARLSDYLRSADVTIHPLAYSDDERIDLFRSSLRLKANPPVGQILHMTGDIKLLRHLARRVAKSNPLHMTREVNGGV